MDSANLHEKRRARATPGHLLSFGQVCAEADLRFYRWGELGGFDPRRRAPDLREAVREALLERRSPLRAPSATPDRTSLDPATIRFVKIRGTEDQRLVAVVSEDRHGAAMFHVAMAERDGGEGWICTRVAGGSAFPSRGEDDWVHFEWLLSQTGFNAGGQVVRNPDSVTEVRLRRDDGLELAADADDGAVLFLADALEWRPSAIDIYDRYGRLLATQDAPSNPRR